MKGDEPCKLPKVEEVKIKMVNKIESKMEGKYQKILIMMMK